MSLLTPIDYAQIPLISLQGPHLSSSRKSRICKHITYIVKNHQQKSERLGLACQISWMLADVTRLWGQRKGWFIAIPLPKYQHLYYFPDLQLLAGDINWARWSLPCITGEGP